MKSQIVSKRVLLFLLIIGGALQGNAQSVTQSNPGQYLIIETGNRKINDSIKAQTETQKNIVKRQTPIAGEFTKIKQWEGKYNSYLKDARGYAEAIKAGSSLVAEGVEILRHIHEIKKAVAANPQGIGATLAMNDIYLKTTVELIYTFRLMKSSIALGTKKNMLTGAERTELLWQINDALDTLNKKLRRLALSIAYYNISDVWKSKTAGMVERSHKQIAADAMDRWQRAQKAYMIISE